MTNLVIIIGVSRYNHVGLEILPGARKDAENILLFFTERGLHRDKINFLIDENATNDNIDSALNDWIALKSENSPVRLFLFFFGHGMSIGTGNSQKSYLLLHDSKPQYGYSISSIIEKINLQTGINELYLFIDACNISIKNVIINFQELLKKNEDYQNRSFLCVIASNAQKAFESNKGGFFTNAFINAIQKLEKKKSDPLIFELALEISQILSKYSFLYPPADIHIGGNKSWPFKKIPYDSDRKIIVDRQLVENEILKKVNQQKNTPFTLFGEPGIGKTNLLYQCYLKSSSSLYVNIGGNGFYNDSLKLIISEICIQKKIHIARFAEETSIELFKEISDQGHLSNTTIFIDGNSIEQNTRIDLMIFFSQYNIQTCWTAHKPILSKKIHVLNFQCPLLSKEESILLMKKLGYTNSQFIESVYRTTAGHPLNLRLLAKKTFLDNYFKYNIETTRKIITSGCFIDKYEFCKIQKIDESEIDQLEFAGLIYKINGIYYPHSKLLDKYINTAELSLYITRTIKYWEYELNATRNLLFSAKKFLAFIDQTRSNILKYDVSISKSILIHTSFGEFSVVPMIFRKVSNSKNIFINTLLTLSSVFAEIGDFNKVKSIYEKLNRRKGFEISNLSTLYYSRSLWWKGDYDECIKICKNILNNSKTNEEKSRAHLEIGISEFFLGEWAKSKNSIKSARITSDMKIIGWCDLIEGSIEGITGIDFENGVKKITHAINILETNQDIVGTAIAYGNLGEALWKQGDITNAKKNLVAGFRFAKKANMKLNMIENKRNLLHIEIKLNYSSPVVTALINELANLKNIGKMISMQLSNTLATAYLYQNELTKSHYFISKAEKLTRGNKEYHIYTLGNYFLYFLMNRNLPLSKKYFNEFLFLAKRGHNYLAIKQIEDDLKQLYLIYNLEKSEIFLNIINNFKKTTYEIFN